MTTSEYIGYSGFNRDDEWGYRAMEPSRCCISSIALVLLKTGIIHSTGATGEKQVTIDYAQMGTAQKLLLFWRKPAVRVLLLASTSNPIHGFLCSVSAGGMVSKLASPILVNQRNASSYGLDVFGLWNSLWYVDCSCLRIAC